MIPEADSKTVFEDIKRGAPPPRARDRGLTVRHLEQFFNPSIFQGFDDGPDVRLDSPFSRHLAFRGILISYIPIEFLHDLPQPFRSSGLRRVTIRRSATSSAFVWKFDMALDGRLE